MKFANKFVVVLVLVLLSTTFFYMCNAEFIQNGVEDSRNDRILRTTERPEL